MPFFQINFNQQQTMASCLSRNWKKIKTSTDQAVYQYTEQKVKTSSVYICGTSTQNSTQVQTIPCHEMLYTAYLVTTGIYSKVMLPDMAPRWVLYTDVKFSMIYLRSVVYAL